MEVYTLTHAPPNTKIGTGAQTAFSDQLMVTWPLIRAAIAPEIVHAATSKDVPVHGDYLLLERPNYSYYVLLKTNKQTPTETIPTTNSGSTHATPLTTRAPLSTMTSSRAPRSRKQLSGEPYPPTTTKTTPNQRPSTYAWSRPRPPPEGEGGDEIGFSRTGRSLPG